MGKMNVKGGTPSGWASLCTTCTWAHIVSGFRESELVVICSEVVPNFTLPFKVKECTKYLDRNRPSYDAMTKLAIDVEPCSSLKPVGFRAKVEVVKEEEVEASSNRQNFAGGVDDGYFSAGRAPLANSGGRGFDSRRGRKFM
jgi:hypothetical protein